MVNNKKVKKGGGFYFGTPMIGKVPTVYAYNNKCNPIQTAHLVEQPLSTTQSGGKKQKGSGYYFGTPMIDKEPTVYKYSDAKTITTGGKLKKQKGSGYYFGAPMIDKEPTVYSYDDKCSPINQTGGKRRKAEVNTAFKKLYHTLSPLTKAQLSTMAILLTLNETDKIKRQQKGGNQLISMLMPYSKEVLLVLVGLLLLNYYSSSKHKKQIGGDLFSKKLIDVIETNHSKPMMGGFMLLDIQNIIAPLGVEALIASTLLIFLRQLLISRNKRQRGGSNQLHNAITPVLKQLNVEKFLASIGLLALAKDVRNYKKQIGGLGCEQNVYGCQEEWGANLNGCV